MPLQLSVDFSLNVRLITTEMYALPDNSFVTIRLAIRRVFQPRVFECKRAAARSFHGKTESLEIKFYNPAVLGNFVSSELCKDRARAKGRIISPTEGLRPEMQSLRFASWARYFWAQRSVQQNAVYADIGILVRSQLKRLLGYDAQKCVPASAFFMIHKAKCTSASNVRLKCFVASYFSDENNHAFPWCSSRLLDEVSSRVQRKRYLI